MEEGSGAGVKRDLGGVEFLKIDPDVTGAIVVRDPAGSRVDEGADTVGVLATGMAGPPLDPKLDIVASVAGAGTDGATFAKMDVGAAAKADTGAVEAIFVKTEVGAVGAAGTGEAWLLTGAKGLLTALKGDGAPVVGATAELYAFNAALNMLPAAGAEGVAEIPNGPVPGDCPAGGVSINANAGQLRLGINKEFCPANIPRRKRK